jgi:DNA-binding MarR family transcriptional regulator
MRRVSTLDLESIDIATLSLLAGVSANQQLLAAIKASGHPELRNAHGYLFQHLISGPKPVGELAELLGVTQQAVSKTALELEGMGLVARQPDPNDSRIRRVSLTPRGKMVIERSRATRAKLEAELVEAVGARAVSAAKKALIVLLQLTGGSTDVSQRKVKPMSD